MNLLPGWSEELARAPERRAVACQRRIHVPRVDVSRLVETVDAVGDAERGRELLSTIRGLDLAAIALDSEFGFARPPVDLGNGQTWHDVRSQRPICVSLAALTGEGHVVRAVLDVRVPEVAAVLAELLRLRTTFVFHDIKPVLFTFWALGIDPVLPAIFDTYLAAACLHLGRHHKRLVASSSTSDRERIEAYLAAEARRAHLLSLVGQCEHYDLIHPFGGAKDATRKEFLALGFAEGLSAMMLKYAAADAEYTLRLYLAQQSDICCQGIASHLHSIELPFALANARMEWNGVQVDAVQRAKVRTASRRAANHHADVLRAAGVFRPGSRDEFVRLMRNRGLAAHLRRGRNLSVADDVLEAVEHLDSIIRSFRLHRRYSRLANETWLNGNLVAVDGRLHPTHRQLGAATGRNSCAAPNLAGIGRVLRPVVTAPPGRALVELDYAQIEVAVAAAEYGDSALIHAYNSGDVYSAMARRFYAHELAADERVLAPEEFKRARPDLRGLMKTFVLAVIYNIQAHGLASRFSISMEMARRERERFLSMFPVLKRRLEESSAYGIARGYATTVTGLRRSTEPGRRPSGWTRNFLRNTPIQGSAAIVFKRAVVDLDRSFRGTRTWLVLPVHDAVVIECDLFDVDQVCTRAADIMRDALRSFYPELRPKIDVNRLHLGCWNKDGHSDSLDRFLADPTYSLDAREFPTAGFPRSVGPSHATSAMECAASGTLDDRDVRDGFAFDEPRGGWGCGARAEEHELLAFASTGRCDLNEGWSS